jgi:CBS domain-containing protein
VQKVKVAVSWFFDLFCPPALTTVNMDPGSAIGNAHYKGGDFIYKHGDPASDFFVIQNGEVELISCHNGEEQVIAVLTGGDFFGESSLTGRECRSNHARAREDVELLVMGKNIFDQVSSTLSPFREALADAMKRRSSIWQDFPDLQKVVQSIHLNELVEPLITTPLKLDSTLLEAVSKINQYRFEFVFVVDDDGKLQGLVTRSDVLKAIESAAANTADDHHNLKVKDFLEKVPCVVTAGDDTLHAVKLMRESGFKRLPVVDNCESLKLVGSLRIENIMEAVLKHLQDQARVATPASS